MRNVLAGTLLLVALALAGCGGGSSPGNSTNSSGNGEASKPARQVLTDAAKAADAASSVRVSGQVTTKGQQVGLDLTIAKGKGATGSITLKGQKVDLVVIGTSGYMKAGAAFFQAVGGSQGAAIGQMLAGKWFKFPTTNAQFGQIAGFANAKSIFDRITATHGALTNKGATTYKGQSVVAIYDSSKANGGTLYVAATGTPYPVAIAGNGSGSSGSITFDQWNQSVTLTAPSGAIDLSSLGG